MGSFVSFRAKRSGAEESVFNRFLHFGLLRSPTVEMTNTLHTPDSKPKINDLPGDRCDSIPTSSTAKDLQWVASQPYGRNDKHATLQTQNQRLTTCLARAAILSLSHILSKAANAQI